MNSKELQAIKARADAATPGPWYSFTNIDAQDVHVAGVCTNDFGPRLDKPENQNRHQHVVALTLLQMPRYAVHDSLRFDQDAEFIAHARADIPALLAELNKRHDQMRVLIDAVRTITAHIANPTAATLERFTDASDKAKAVLAAIAAEGN